MVANEIKKDILVIIVIFILAHTGVAIKNGGFSGVLQDTDAYMWLNRVTYLHENGAWFDHNYPRINPPLGHEQHWTRPFDIFLLAGASILGPLLGFEKALLVCSLFISPILSIAALLSFFWALYPLFRFEDSPKGMVAILGLLFISQVAIFSSFMWGRSDHQSLIFLLFILTIGFTIRLLLKPYMFLLSLGAGFVSGITLWVSMETSLIIAIILISLSIYWILGNDEIVKKLLIYSTSLFVTVVVALLIEKGFYAFSEVYYDQISIVYAFAIGLNLFLWATIYIWQNLTNISVSKLYRFSLLIFMGFLSGIIINIFFPEFFLGPLHGVDELYRRNRLDLYT